MRAKIEQSFASWQRGGRPRPTTPAVEAAAKTRAGLYLIDKDDVNQSSVIMGRLASRFDDPDYCALTVMNGILGDGFASRLFSQVGSEQALAYAVWSSWGGEYELPGVFSGDRRRIGARQGQHPERHGLRVRCDRQDPEPPGEL